MLLSLLLACAPAPAPTCDAADDTLPLTAIQALGTHNSTHIEPELPLDPSHRYTQPPLPEQLDRFGVRQLELDLHYRDGAGFQVFHLPIIDEETTCLALTTCLQEIRAWSDANPCHAPILVWMEPKDEDADFLSDDLLPLIDRQDELEATLLSVWPRERIFTPDDLRGDDATLPEAIAARGWPALGEVRGRVMFAMLDDGEQRARYLERSAALEGRLLFVDADTPDDPFAAMFKMDDAVGDGELVRERVAAGFLVTSNADAADEDDGGARFDATLAAGSHYLSSDRLLSDPPAAIPGGEPARCNPISAPAGCAPADVEDLGGG